MWHYLAAAEKKQRYHALNTCGHFSSSAELDNSFRDWSRQAFPASHCQIRLIAMATTGNPEAQSYDTTQDLLVVECQNNAIQNPDVNAAQTDANEKEPVGGVMDAASRMEEQKSTNKERRREFEQAKRELIGSVLLSIFLPVYLGLYTVLSIQYTAASNDQSQVANQIALLALCYSNSVGHRGRLAKDKLLMYNSLVISAQTFWHRPTYICPKSRIIYTVSSQYLGTGRVSLLLG